MQCIQPIYSNLKWTFIKFEGVIDQSESKATKWKGLIV